MQLIAGRTGQEYDQRKGRPRAFWEDRYHASAIEPDEHLHRCLVYIDLNMVRAGAVSYPAKRDGKVSGLPFPSRFQVVRLNQLGCSHLVPSKLRKMRDAPFCTETAYPNSTISDSVNSAFRSSNAESLTCPVPTSPSV